MKNAMLLLTVLFSVTSFAAEISEKQMAAENAVKEMFNMKKSLINPYQTSQFCINGKCSRTIDAQKRNPKFLNLTSLYSDNFLAKCEKDLISCEANYMFVSTNRQFIAQLSRTPHITSKTTAENKFDVTFSLSESKESKKVVYHVVCAEKCLIDGYSTVK